jgi:hypothetical protein
LTPVCKMLVVSLGGRGGEGANPHLPTPPLPSERVPWHSHTRRCASWGLPSHKTVRYMLQLGFWLERLSAIIRGSPAQDWRQGWGLPLVHHLIACPHAQSGRGNHQSSGTTVPLVLCCPTVTTFSLQRFFTLLTPLCAPLDCSQGGAPWGGGRGGDPLPPQPPRRWDIRFVGWGGHSLW